ncbi:uncharacterized protein LOC108734325 [Agrilus planipennis]|uniref:Uncharacterized protein LOC108734325 n=1 Tax=Agrilus planipennis TaxID=224129 RepID=A0A1W4WLJ6_AGRPL|nr:uncharacterized protein LOC108734325 [Agrilus planipennis]
MPHCKEIKLGNVWRSCNKIRSAIFRVGLNLWEYYLPLDHGKTNLITESQFTSVLSGPLKIVLALSDQEISELADYFKVPDGRILYRQLCEVIHGSVPDFSKNEPLVSGLEWEDPLQVNRLSGTEERRLSVLITKIASIVNLRKLLLMPFFQDYELVTKNNGTVTIAHFARILDYLKILVSADDFNLLIKRYQKDGYTINYMAFVNDIDNTIKYMEAYGILDLGGDVVSQFPGRVISAELPKLPRPEIGKILAASIFGKQSIFHPALEPPKEQRDLMTLMTRIQRHILENRIRLSEFFEDFDPLRCGKVTVSQFHRCLDAIGISGLHRLYLSLPEIETIVTQYKDPIDAGRVCWKTFEDDVNQVFTTQELEKCPSPEIEKPPQEVANLPKMGAKVWDNVQPPMRDLCEEAVEKVKNKTMKRGILLKPWFRDYDKNNNGHVSRSQMRQSILASGILLSDEELYALEERFNDDVGFNYFWFLREVEPKMEEEPLYAGYVEEMKKVNAPKRPRPGTNDEKDIIQVLAKIKGKVVRERVNIMQFMRDYDRCNEEVIHRADFERALSAAGFALTPCEMETITEIFSSPKRCCCVDYKRFCETVEEAFTQACLHRAPLIIPLQHVPAKDCTRNFLNFDERQTVNNALQKLCKKPDLKTNLMSIFTDYDKTKCGTVSQHMFMKALSLRNMADMISRKEFDAVCKAFGFERGMRDEVDYRAFMKLLDILHANDKHLPF